MYMFHKRVCTEGVLTFSSKAKQLPCILGLWLPMYLRYPRNLIPQAQIPILPHSSIVACQACTLTTKP